ncbi:MAG: FtsX-like permease family protein [Bacteroidetes bacterium]|nr:FtsX-like permease family protein [Bacteroidota bacterium]
MVEEIWNEYNTLTPFEYYHLDESYDNLYKKDVKNGILVTAFTLLTILIACLGIYGMITFYVQRKTKEIAIRKTLGAATKQIIWQMTWSVSKWAVLAYLASIPVSLFISNKLLETYINKVSFNWWIYPLTFVAIFLIVILTSLSKTIRIARMNLSQPLKYE